MSVRPFVESSMRGWGGNLWAITVAGGCLLGLLLTGARCTSQKTDLDTDPMVVVSYGGTYQNALRESLFGPFETDTGISLRDEAYDGTYAKLKRHANPPPDWDVVDVSMGLLQEARRDSLLVPINYEVVDTSDLLPEARHRYGVGVVSWAWVLAYRHDAFSGPPPNSWRDFFDVERYPGGRGLRDTPRRVLEMALLADGVPADQLYPLDVDRAFQKLETFVEDLRSRGHSLVWWDSYSRPQELLSDQEVVMTPAANGRIQLAQSDGKPFRFTWNQGILDVDWWVVLRGTSHREEAMHFIDYAASTEVQAQLARTIPYGPVNRRAYSRISGQRLDQLPSAPTNAIKQTYYKSEWWARRGEDVEERWNQWRSSQAQSAP